MTDDDHEDDYYQRQLGPGGSWETDGDRANETAAAALLERVWKCKLVKWPKYCTLDRYAEKDDRLAAVVEIKCRNCVSTTYPTSFLPSTKYLALTFAGLAFGCPAIYAVRYQDGVWYVPLVEVDGSITRVTSRRLPPEPQALVEIPLDKFRRAVLP